MAPVWGALKSGHLKLIKPLPVKPMVMVENLNVIKRSTLWEVKTCLNLFLSVIKWIGNCRLGVVNESCMSKLWKRGETGRQESQMGALSPDSREDRAGDTHPAPCPLRGSGGGSPAPVS